MFAYWNFEVSLIYKKKIIISSIFFLSGINKRIVLNTHELLFYINRTEWDN